jgi:PAS domain S-box-containing protein
LSLEIAYMTTIADRAKYFRKFILRAVAFPIILLLLFAIVLIWRIFAIMESAKWVDQTDQVIAQANDTLKLAVDAETGERGYLVDRRTLFLQPYNEAQSRIGPAFDRLRSLTANRPLQAQRVDWMRIQYDNWLDEANIELNLAASSPNTYRSYFDEAKGKALMDGLRQQFASFIRNEESIKTLREEEVNSATVVTILVSAALAVILGTIIGAVSLAQLRQLGVQYEKALTQSQENEELLSATLLGIGDAVLVTDAVGRVSQMNSIAEKLTGWKTKEALGHDAKKVFNIINESTRDVVESPIDRVIRDGVIVGLANHTLLIKKDGTETPIDDSGAPIRNDSGHLIGVVLVFRDISERKQAEDVLARLYDREHRIAENLQRSLLSTPDPDLFATLEIETFYQPAWSEAKVGGDYYDLFPLGGGKIAMIVGDVSGKGLQAASRTSEMKYTLRAYLREYSDCVIAANRLNSFVCESLESDAAEEPYFLCLTLVILDQATNKGTIVVAGSEPPFVVSSDGSVRTLDVGGPPIGVSREPQYSDLTFVLSDGDMLVIATDGITEARCGKEFLGADGLAQFASRSVRSRSVQQISDSIIADVKAYCGDEIHDDVCMLICRPRS